MKLKVLITIIFLANCFVLAWSRNPELKARYDFPAKAWESEAMPLGNGNLGAMVFGGVSVDSIQVNEHSLWSGGPGKNPNYDGGHLRTAEQNKQALQNARTALQEKMMAFSATDFARIDADGKVTASNYPAEDSLLKSDIKNLMGNKNDFGAYQSLSHINIACNNEISSAYTNYSRELDIDNAVAKVAYMQDGVNYVREYFVSHPDNVIVIRLSADKRGKISRTFYLTSLQTNISMNASGNVITLEGKPADQGANGLKFAQQLMIIPAGGTLTAGGNKITVEKADEILLISSAATNYIQSMDSDFNYFSGINPLATVENNINQASKKTFNQLLERHVQDYKSLYDRMSVMLGNAANENNKTVDKLLEGYKNNANTAAENLYLEQLYYQFGRYLLISSSRENGLPANLQGIWAEGLTPPWDADYHTNINLQMNYWLAEQTNLADCHLPVIEYIKSLIPRGRYTAQHYYCKQDSSPVRGWVIHHENNIWGNTAPGNWYEGFYFPAAAAWMCQDIWEHYRFSQDKQFLQDNYPALLDAALFWVDNLWRDSRDETLVANPSYSPEHGQYSLGASCDQAIIYELFDMVVKASDILGKDTPEVAEIKTTKSQLAGPAIGLGGQFMEWKDEILMDLTGDGQHRHANHLFWLHPGDLIIPGRSPQEDLYVEAMKKSLNTRGDGGTGWSKAWKINFWARLRDGNRSHKLLEELLKESTLTNLFDTHPPFQIDGNFGATAGMTEMLVQSQGDCIEILPALPDAWATGSFKGIKARGNFEIDAEWRNGKVTFLKITSGSGNDCVVKCNGKTVAFKTEAGKSYDLNTKKIGN